LAPVVREDGGSFYIDIKNTSDWYLFQRASSKKELVNLLYMRTRTTLEAREDYPRRSRGLSSRPSRRQFANDKGMLWCRQSGTLLARKRYFDADKVVLCCR